MNANRLRLFIKRRRKKFTYVILAILLIVLCYCALRKHAEHTKSMSHRSVDNLSDETCSAFFVVLSFRILFDSLRPMWIPKKTKELIKSRLTPYTKKPKRSIYIDTNLSSGGLPVSMLKHTSVYGKDDGGKECGYVWAFDKDDREVKYDTCSDHSLENLWKFCRLPPHLISLMKTGGVDALNEYCMPNLAVSWPLHGEEECLNSETDVDEQWVGYAKSLDRDLMNDVISKLVGYSIISWRVLGLLVDYDKDLLDSGLSIFNNTTPLYAETKFSVNRSNQSDSLKDSSIQTSILSFLGKTHKPVPVMSVHEKISFGPGKDISTAPMMRDSTSDSIISSQQMIKRNKRGGSITSKPDILTDKHGNYKLTEPNVASTLNPQSTKIVDELLSEVLTTITPETFGKMLNVVSVSTASEKAQIEKKSTPVHDHITNTLMEGLVIEPINDAENRKLFYSFLQEIYPEFFTAPEMIINTHEAISTPSTEKSSTSYDEIEGSAIDEFDVRSDKGLKTKGDHINENNLNDFDANVPSKSTSSAAYVSQIDYSSPVMESIISTVGEAKYVDGSPPTNILQSTDTLSPIITTTTFSSLNPDQSKNIIIDSIKDNLPFTPKDDKLLISSHDIELFKNLLYKIYHVLVSGTVPVSTLSNTSIGLDRSTATVYPDFSESATSKDNEKSSVFDFSRLQPSLRTISPISKLPHTTEAEVLLTSSRTLTFSPKISHNGQGNRYSTTDMDVTNENSISLVEEYVSYGEENNLSADENKATVSTEKNTAYTKSKAKDEPELTVLTTNEIQSGTINSAGYPNPMEKSESLRTTEKMVLPSTIFSMSLHSSSDSNTGFDLPSMSAVPISQSSVMAASNTDFSSTVSFETTEDLISTTLSPNNAQHSFATTQTLPHKLTVGSTMNTIQIESAQQSTVSETSKPTQDVLGKEYTRELSLTTVANSPSTSTVNVSGLKQNLTSIPAAPVTVSHRIIKPDEVKTKLYKSLDIDVMPLLTNAFFTSTQSSSTLKQNLKYSSATAVDNSSSLPPTEEILHLKLLLNTSSPMIAARENITQSSPKESNKREFISTTLSMKQTVKNNLKMSENLSLSTAGIPLGTNSNASLVEQTGIHLNRLETQSRSVNPTEQQLSTDATIQHEASGSGSGSGFSVPNKLVASSTAVNLTSAPGILTGLVTSVSPLIASSTLEDVKYFPTKLSSVSWSELDGRVNTESAVSESDNKLSTLSVNTLPISASNFESTTVSSVSNKEDKTNMYLSPLTTDKVHYINTTSSTATFRDKTTAKSSQLSPSTVHFAISHSRTEPEDSSYSSTPEEVFTSTPIDMQSPSPNAKIKAVRLSTKSAMSTYVYHSSKMVPSSTIMNINPKSTLPVTSKQSSRIPVRKDKFVPIVEISSAIIGKWFQYNLTTVWTDKLIKNKSFLVNVTSFSANVLQSAQCDLIATEWLNFNSELKSVCGVPVSKNCSSSIFQISAFMISLTDDSNNMVVPPVKLHVSVYPLIQDISSTYKILTDVDLVLKGSGEWEKDEINEKAPAAFITALHSYFKSKVRSVQYSSFSILSFQSVADPSNETVSQIFPVQIIWNIDNITTADFDSQFKHLLVDPDTKQMSYDLFIAMLPLFIVTDVQVIEKSQDVTERKQPMVDTIHSDTGSAALKTVLPPTLLGLCLLIMCVAMIFVRKNRGPVYHINDRLFDKTFGPNRKPIYLDHDIEMECFESSQSPVTPLEYTSDYTINQDSSFTLSDPSSSTSGGGSFSSSNTEKPFAKNPSRVKKTGTGSSTLRFDDIFKVQSQETSFTSFQANNFVHTNPAFYLSNEETCESSQNN